MKVILFGATGMVGQGVLRECLNDPDVTQVLSIARSSTGVSNPKLREVKHSDFTNFEPIADQLSGYDACFFCLGVSSAGMKEADYRHITYDFTLAAAKALVARNPGMTFVYVSGAGTDSTERGRMMWARVKGKTENDLLALGFRAAFMFRPGMIVPLDGIRPKVKWLAAIYTGLRPVLPIARRLFPRHVLTTRQIGQAMLEVARHGAPKPVLEAPDLAALAPARD